MTGRRCSLEPATSKHGKNKNVTLSGETVKTMVFQQPVCAVGLPGE